MFTGNEIVELLTDMGITHVVWVPDSTLGQWEHELRCSEAVQLIGVCREGEAWAVAFLGDLVFLCSCVPVFLFS